MSESMGGIISGCPGDFVGIGNLIDSGASLMIHWPLFSARAGQKRLLRRPLFAGDNRLAFGGVVQSERSERLPLWVCRTLDAHGAREV
jgi:hypothetical protein